METDNNKLGQKIRLERTKRKLSQQALALLASIDKNTIWKIETGQTEPTIKTLKKIAKAFGMDIATLVDVTKFDL